MQSQCETQSPFAPRQRLEDPRVSEMNAEWDSEGLVQGLILGYSEHPGIIINSTPLTFGRSVQDILYSHPLQKDYVQNM